MFDEFTFALRYGPVVYISFALVSWEIPTPITRKTIDRLKRAGVWERVEPIFGPYAIPDK